MQGFSTLAWYWQAVLVTNRRLVFLHSEKYAKVTQVLNKWRESAWTEKRKEFRVLMLVRGMDDGGAMPITILETSAAACAGHPPAILSVCYSHVKMKR